MHLNSRRSEAAIAVFLLELATFFLWEVWRMPAGTFGVPDQERKH